jgi:hypothetical protein
MRNLLALLLLPSLALAHSVDAQLPEKDVVRIREFYRLASQISDQVWPNWASTPAPLMLVTQETEFLTHHPNPPNDFHKIANDLYSRPRHFPANFLATFPAFGPLSVIVIGEAEATEAKTSTPWLFVAMHEHFHQLQDSQPGLFDALKGLGLAHGDETGMWMLNFPFPYDKPQLGRDFAQLRDLLLAALNETNEKEFRILAERYVSERKAFFAQLSTEDRKYLSFQLWKEGIARYIQIKSAEAAAHYQPTPEYVALPDYESFASYAGKVRSDTLNELKRADLAKWKRVVVYSFGASEGLLLDRLNPSWKDGYLRNLFTLDPYFEK